MIPVLADDANFPAETSLPPSLGRLVYQNGVRVRADDRFGADVARLLQGVSPPRRAGRAADARPLAGRRASAGPARDDPGFRDGHRLIVGGHRGRVDEPVHGVVSVRPGAHRTRDPGGAGACGWGEVRRGRGRPAWHSGQ